MPLVLNASSLRAKLTAKGPGGLALTDLPAFVRDELGLSGLLLTTDLLVGADRTRLSKILEAADKAGCPVLSLAETNPQPLGTEDDRQGDLATERVLRVAQAAHIMGCSSFGIPITSPDNEDALDLVAERLKIVVRKAERMDLNLCIMPAPLSLSGTNTSGELTATPEKIGELLKRIGGFRIGTMADFAHAARCQDTPGAGPGSGGVGYLRRLVPYASVVIASGLQVQHLIAQPQPESQPKAKVPKLKAKSADKPAPTSASAAQPSRREKSKDLLAELAEQISAELEAEVMGATPEPAPPALTHVGYDIKQFASVLIAVGYEGPIALDYRGTGDPVEALLHIKGILGSVISEGSDNGVLNDPLLDALTGLDPEDLAEDSDSEKV